MHEGICNVLLTNNVQFLYVTNRVLEKTALNLAAGLTSFHCEASINEKIAFELALTCSWASKRTACLVSSEGLYEALDPLMSSAYTGTAGGFLIIAVQENDEEVTPLGQFSKLPVLVTENTDEFSRAVEFGYYISGKYKIPVVIQTAPLEDKVQGLRLKVQGRETGDQDREAGNRKSEMANRKEHGPEGMEQEMVVESLSRRVIESKKGYEPTQRPNDPTTQRPAEFAKTPARWAATPRFRYELHKELNDKIEKIRTEFEGYEGNKKIIKSKTGLITDRLSYREYYDEDISILKITTVHPLPEKLIMDFIGEMDQVFLSETYPAIEFQIPDRSKVAKGLAGMVRRGPRPEETIYGLHVVRDKLGPASSINMAHGIRKCSPEKKVLAITYEDFFLHSGMPAFVNTVYNGSVYLLLIMSNTKEDEIREILRGFSFSNCHTIATMQEVERFKDSEELTVLFCRGIG
jgi:TPP-dependent indolepyruvate ferredoxin oxidoreductase alpha subunit